MKLQCQFIQKCSGCSSHEQPLSTQLEMKKNSLLKDLASLNLNVAIPIAMIPTFEREFRDKVDLTLETIDDVTRIGFYEKYIPEEQGQVNELTSQLQTTLSISSTHKTLPKEILANGETTSSESHSFQKKKILDISACPLFSKNLMAFYSNFRKVAPKIKKGSIRLRVSPEGKRGLWLDFSNNDINQLLESQTELKKLYDICDIVEVGQKRKTLIKNGARLEFQYSKLQPWFETYIRIIKTENSFPTESTPNQDEKDGVAIQNSQHLNSEDLLRMPVYLNIAGFSQTGLETNKIIIEEVLKMVVPLKIKSWLELCSGSGNLTFPLASISEKLTATELDPSAISGMRYSIQKNIEFLKTLNLDHTFLFELKNKLQNIKTEQINIHKPNEKLKNLLQAHEGLLVDPPRSGLGDFLENMNDVKKEKLPKYFVYLSCFQESLIKDIKKALSLGYEIKKIIGIDQFPYTPHCEWLVQLALV